MWLDRATKDKLILSGKSQRSVSCVKGEYGAEWVCRLETPHLRRSCGFEMALTRFSIHVKAVRAGTTVTPQDGSSARGIWEPVDWAEPVQEDLEEYGETTSGI